MLSLYSMTLNATHFFKWFVYSFATVAMVSIRKCGATLSRFKRVHVIKYGSSFEHPGKRCEAVARDLDFRFRWQRHTREVRQHRFRIRSEKIQRMKQD